jgi:hypothetical protein
MAWHGMAWHGMHETTDLFDKSWSVALQFQFNSISFFIIISDLDPDLIGIVIVPGGVWGTSIVSNL